MTVHRTSLRWLQVAIVAALVLCARAPAFAAAVPDACVDTSGSAVGTAIDTAAKTLEIDVAIPSSRFAPVGGEMDLAIAAPYDAKPAPHYRVITRAGRPDSHIWGDPVEFAQLSVRQVDPTLDKPIASQLGNASATGTIIRAPIDAPGGYWMPGRIYVLACDTHSLLTAIYATRDMELSPYWACFVIAFAVVALIYGLIAVAVRAWNIDGQTRARDAEAKRARPIVMPKQMQLVRTWIGCFNPIEVVTANDGLASTARIQILFFTMVVSFVLLLVLLRAGVLSDMSPTIVTLLGISGVGAVASKGTDVAKNRLSFDNWSWFVERGWLPYGGMRMQRTASWRDLVTSADGFDVYKFQMLLFSIIVGVAIIEIGAADLAGFTIPEALMGLLGLSQVVYVGGRLADPPAVTELNTAVDALRAIEDDPSTALREEGAQTKPGIDPVRAMVAFARQRDRVRTMFVSLYGALPRNAQMDPVSNRVDGLVAVTQDDLVAGREWPTHRWPVMSYKITSVDLEWNTLEALARAPGCADTEVEMTVADALLWMLKPG